ncbi:MAG: pyridoxamine 5'-phosphate oxidase family protein [Hyphomicrobiaceae bacterium]|nr:pyridoxamine 5'-phosphate oxidase family protein [Hyphomicrobiaceae bacterium]
MPDETAFDPSRISYVASFEEVRARHPEPMTRATGKVLARLDRHCKAMIARSTFCVISTFGPSGADVSPRGDPAGFVRVLDDQHLLLPDRIGNNRFDTMGNLFSNPAVGMLFLIPGMAEILRVNGTARVTDDAGLLAASTVQGRAPKVGLLVTVGEAYLHCAKAINRAGLWDATRHIDRAALPSYGDMLAEQVEGLTREESERQGAEMARRGMY